jgi:hypothetical protein
MILITDLYSYFDFLSVQGLFLKSLSLVEFFNGGRLGRKS